MPYAVQFEQELDKKLLTKPERTGLRNYLKHKFDASVLLRADAVGRAKLYDSMFSKGALKPDEIRADDDRVPLNTDASNTTYMQLSYVPIDELVRIQTEKLANPNKQKIDEQNIKKEEDDESE